MRSFISQLLLTVAVVLISALATAGPVEDLLALPHRPTVAEIKNAFGGQLPEANPFGTPTGQTQVRVTQNAPVVIAMFEKLYPGATFAPLGRDSVFLGDVIDAFYQSLGQDRVRRVSASGNSLTGKPDDIVDFLKDAGFDISRLKVAYPFVMFDQTNWSSDSQSTAYVRAVARECKNRGCDPYLLFEKFDFINTGATNKMYAKNVFSPTFDLKEFQAKNREAIAKSGQIKELVSVPVDKGLTYTTEYHGTFDKFKRQGDGSIIAKPGAMSSNSIRLQILADVFAAAQAVSKPSFLAAVDEEARKLGYKFPRFRVWSTVNVERIRGIEPDPSRLEAEKAAIEKSLNAAVDAKTSVTAALTELMAKSPARQSLEEAEFQVEYIKAALRGFELHLVTPEEMARFVSRLLAEAKGPLTPYARLLNKSSLLKKIWRELIEPSVFAPMGDALKVEGESLYSNLRAIQDETNSTLTRDEAFRGNLNLVLVSGQTERMGLSAKVARLMELEVKYREKYGSTDKAPQKFWPFILSEVKRAKVSGALTQGEAADVLAASLALSAHAKENSVDQFIAQDAVLRQILSAEQGRLHTLHLELGKDSRISAGIISQRLTGLSTSGDPRVAPLKATLQKAAESELLGRVFDGLKPLSQAADENLASANWKLVMAELERHASMNPDFLSTSSAFLFENVERLRDEEKLSAADIREFLIYIVESPIFEREELSDALALSFRRNGFMRSEFERHLIWFRESNSMSARRFMRRQDLGFRRDDDELRRGGKYLRSLKPSPDAVNGHARIGALRQLVSRLDDVQGILQEVVSTDHGSRLAELELAVLTYELTRKQMAKLSGPGELLWLTDVSPRFGDLLLKARAWIEIANREKIDPLVHALLVTIKFRSKQAHFQAIDLMRAANELLMPIPLPDPSANFNKQTTALKHGRFINRLVLEVLAASAVATLSSETAEERKREIALALIESSLSALRGIKISRSEFHELVRAALTYGGANDKAFSARLNTLYTYHKEVRDAVTSIAASSGENPAFSSISKKAPGSCRRALRKLIGI